MRNKNHNKTPSVNVKDVYKLIKTSSSKYDNIMNRMKKIQSPKNIIEDIIGRNQSSNLNFSQDTRDLNSKISD